MWFKKRINPLAADVQELRQSLPEAVKLAEVHWAEIGERLLIEGAARREQIVRLRLLVEIEGNSPSISTVFRLF